MKKLLPKRLTRSLSAKLILTFLLVLTLSIAIISSLYYWFSANIIAQHVRESARQSAKQSADYLSLLLTVGSDVGQQISRDTRIQQVIREEARGGVTVDQKFNHKSTVDAILNNVMYTSSFVRSVYLLREQGSSWGSGLFNASKAARFTLGEHQWYADAVGGRVDELWLPLQYDPFSGGGENTELVLTFVKPFRNLDTREAIGAIVVNLDGKRILQAIERIRLGTSGGFFVVDEGGRVTIASDPGRWNAELAGTELGDRLASMTAEELEFETALDGVDSYVVSRRMEGGWTIVGTVPVEEVVGDIQRIQRMIWIYASALLVLAGLVGLQFSRRITSPLNRLMHQMREIEKSNFKALSEVTSEDEIGQLSRRFNQMVRQIEALLRQVNEVEGKKRAAEMRALRHQINPHFLYNTLSSIRWMVRIRKFDGAYDGISALVKLMEASMEKQGAFCSLRDELDLLDKYMVIQRFRYGDQIRLDVRCDESLLDVRIPRMLLQPIVENAVFHGIAPKEEGGCITVTARKEGDAGEAWLLIEIADDGLGIPPERIDGLLRRERDARSGLFGIGLNHVHETIQLYYGADSGVRIESEAGVGTVIRLRIRMETGEGHGV